MQNGTDEMQAVLLPGRTPIRSQSQVTFEMKAAMRDLVYKPKIIQYKGTNFDTNPTWHDMTKLLDGVFAGGWVTGEPHQMCSKNTIKPSMDDVAVQVGFFTKNIGATSTGIIDTPKSKATSGHKNAKGTPGNGSKATKVKKLRRHPATKHLVTKKALEGATEAYSSARQVNKPVYMSSQAAKEPGVATFTFYDGNHKILPGGIEDFVKIDPSVGSLEKARGRAMQLHDEFKMSRCREYNIRAAIYLARNRLTYWANGNDVKSRPKCEDKDLFVEYKLMRNMEHFDKAAMEMCREGQVMELWEGMDHLF